MPLRARLDGEPPGVVRRSFGSGGLGQRVQGGLACTAARGCWGIRSVSERVEDTVTSAAGATSFVSKTATRPLAMVGGILEVGSASLYTPLLLPCAPLRSLRHLMPPAVLLHPGFFPLHFAWTLSLTLMNGWSNYDFYDRFHDTMSGITANAVGTDRVRRRCLRRIELPVTEADHAN